ncbi:hypothetical protein DH2020_016182 [Rehmannia glutinosa]|uniref:Uncharacterized protein n=1 Tax=Rehmannia glutinosa TaxID=99300 RepID=A0ABR0WVJ9_REHGL
MLSEGPMEVTALFGVLSWTIWNTRNRFVFDEGKFCFQEVITKALKLFHEIQHTRETNEPHDGHQVCSTETSETESTQLKLYSDAAIYPDSTMGFGFVILNQENSLKMAGCTKGQILPLRHSENRNGNRSISRSESLDHYYSGGLISSRSSSISSHQSSSSGSSTATIGPKSRPKLLPPRNQFHSHPSPSPKIRIPTKRNTTISPNHTSVWNIFRLGLLTAPPEIAFQDLKPRTNCRNFGSRNSTDSNNSSISSSSRSNKKKIPRGLLSGCKCSVDAVDTVAPRVVIIKRSASESDVEALQPPKMMKKQAAKKQLSHHRTFEWLKQLSIEDEG